MAEFDKLLTSMVAYENLRIQVVEVLRAYENGEELRLDRLEQALCRI